MPASPNISLGVTLDSCLGPGVNGYVRVTLCGYGPQPPCVPGTGMMADAGVPQLQGPADTFALELFGNNQITPAETFYMIEILDENQNVVQSGNYPLNGPLTTTLDQLTPTINPPYNVRSGYLVINPASGAVAVDDNGWNGPIILDFTLAANTSPSLLGFNMGQFVQFIIRQPAGGNCTFTWPANVENPPAVNQAPNSVTTANFFVDINGNFYPQLGWN